MKNKLLADALIVIVLSMLPNKLVATDASASESVESESFLERTCGQSAQLIPMLMGHTNLAQFALLGLQFPEEILGPVGKEQVVHIRGTHQSVKHNISCLLDHGKATCVSLHEMMSCHLSAEQRFMSI